MSIVTIVIGVILIGVLLVSEMSNMLLTAELVLMMLFAAPIYFYKKKDMKVFNAYLFMMTLMIVSRYITSTIIVEYASVVTLPLSMEVQLVRQFTGVGVTAVWYLWYSLVFLATLITNHDSLKKCHTVDEVRTHKGFIHNNNFFTVTGIVFVVNLISGIFVYNMQSLATRVFINIFIVIGTMGVYKWYSQKMIIERIVDIKKDTEDKGKESKCVIFNVNEDEMIQYEDKQEESGGDKD